MSRISEIMSRQVQVVTPNDTLQRAAQTMDELNIGALPVCDGEQLVGIITDRDITIRGVAAGKEANSTPVREIMSPDVEWCFEDEDTNEVLEKMSGGQIRRVPVVDRQKKLVGMVSLGDLATRGGGRNVGETLKDISTPSEADQAQKNNSTPKKI